MGRTKRLVRLLGPIVAITATAVGIGAPPATAAYRVVTTIPVGSQASPGTGVPSPMAPTPDGTTLFVSNVYDNTVSVIDVASGTVTNTLRVCRNPSSIAITPDASQAWVACDDDTWLAVIDTSTYAVTPVTTPFGAIGIAFTADGSTAAVMTWSDLAIVNTQTLATTTVALPTYAMPIIQGPQMIIRGSTVYMLTFPYGAPDPGTLMIADLSSPSDPVQTVEVSPGAAAMVVTPDGKTAFISSSITDRIVVVDLVGLAVINMLHTGASTQGLAITPDGRTVFSANYDSGTVSAIDVATQTPQAVNVPDGPSQLAVSPDGKRVFISDQVDNSLAIMDTTTLKVSAVPVGQTPAAVAVSPDGSRIYVLNLASNSVSVIQDLPDPPAPSVPSAPRRFAAAPGPGRAVLSWQTPASPGSSPITGYTVRTYRRGKTLARKTCRTTATRCTINGLSNGTRYDFTVTASNAVGTGPAATARAKPHPCRTNRQGACTRR